MKKYFLLLIIVITGLSSCDGRKSYKQSLTESIDSFTKNNTIGITNYIPENYFEKQIDTTLSNGYEISILTQSNFSNVITVIEEKNNTEHTTHYKTFDFTIQIKKDNVQVYNKSFKRKDILQIFKNLNTKQLNTIDKTFNEFAILKSIQLNEELSTIKDSIYIDIAYAKPNDDDLNWHTLKINEDGLTKFIEFIN